jgi:hypothetical protein
VRRKENHPRRQWTLDSVIGCHEFDCFGPLELIRPRAEVRHDWRCTHRIDIIEKEGDRCIQNLRLPGHGEALQCQCPPNFGENNRIGPVFTLPPWLSPCPASGNTPCRRGVSVEVGIGVANDCQFGTARRR